MLLVLLVLVVLLLWGGVALGKLRRAWLSSQVALRSKGVGREPGKLYCPECAAVLEERPPEQGLAHQACTGCSGKWASPAALAEAFGKKKKETPVWLADEVPPDDAKAACPRCAKTMPSGNFEDQNFTVYFCSPCDGYWFGRMHWVSLKLLL